MNKSEREQGLCVFEEHGKRCGLEAEVWRHILPRSEKWGRPRMDNHPYTPPAETGRKPTVAERAEAMGVPLVQQNPRANWEGKPIANEPAETKAGLGPYCFFCETHHVHPEPAAPVSPPDNALWAERGTGHIPDGCAPVSPPQPERICKCGARDWGIIHQPLVNGDGWPNLIRHDFDPGEVAPVSPEPPRDPVCANCSRPLSTHGYCGENCRVCLNDGLTPFRGAQPVQEIDDRPLGPMHVCEKCGTEWDVADECPNCLKRRSHYGPSGYVSESQPVSARTERVRAQQGIPPTLDETIEALKNGSAVVVGHQPQKDYEIAWKFISKVHRLPFKEAHSELLQIFNELRVAQSLSAQTPPDVELISAKVHEQWMESKRLQGISSRKSESGEELMVPYDQLSEAAKEIDRGSVRAVLSAIGGKPSNEENV